VQKDQRRLRRESIGHKRMRIETGCLTLSRRTLRSRILLISSKNATRACAMKMEFRRLDDGKRVLPDRPWHEGLPAELLEHAKAALMSFYDGNEHDFWAKPQFREGGLPEEVRIVDDAGKVVARYDAREAIADYLVGKVNVKIGRNFLE
jgi:hypothetical protein